ncbi:MAG: purine-nucleoside phosphorylase, partial [Actinobacteria bacterium]|nr:purine-nucleoside phosphorylase [Actinomycetota bacterium]
MSAEHPRLPGPGDRLPEEAVAAIRERSDLVPKVAVVLGSGLRVAADALEEEASWAYSELPGMVPPTVPGHEGRLALGMLHGVPTAVFLGRLHHYESHPMAAVTLAVRVARHLGARILVVTASVGALDPSLAVGTLGVGIDHLNMMGENPLRGWRQPDGSPTFLDASALYDPELAKLALDEAAALGIAASEAVY